MNGILLFLFIIILLPSSLRSEHGPAAARDAAALPHDGARGHRQVCHLQQEQGQGELDAPPPTIKIQMLS
jgi:hypothetical protein